MKLNIERAILHALDPASGAPVLSEEPMALDEEVRDFLEAHFLKCLESDEVQMARLREESVFGQRMRALGREGAGLGDGGFEGAGAADGARGPAVAFVDESRHLAEQIFQILSGNPEVPAGDLICMLCSTGS